jgi:hypothetical protein
MRITAGSEDVDVAAHDLADQRFDVVRNYIKVTKDGKFLIWTRGEHSVHEFASM